LAGLVKHDAGFGIAVAGFLLPRIGIVTGGDVIASILNAFIGAVIARRGRPAPAALNRENAKAAGTERSRGRRRGSGPC
jgi:hypothetical protein